MIKYEPFDVTYEYDTGEEDEGGVNHDFFLEMIDEKMNKCNPGKKYFLVGFLNGWNNQGNGYTFDHHNNAHELLKYCIPHTNEYHIKVRMFKDEFGSFKIETNCKHHDKPYDGDNTHIVAIGETEFNISKLNVPHYKSMKYALIKAGLSDQIKHKIEVEKKDSI